MTTLVVQGGQPLRGRLRVPGDKGPACRCSLNPLGGAPAEGLAPSANGAVSRHLGNWQSQELQAPEDTFPDLRIVSESYKLPQCHTYRWRIRLDS